MSNESGGFYGSDSADVDSEEHIDAHAVMVTVPLSLIRAVAHIGVDFGYGKYELEQEHIDCARNIIESSD